MPDEAFWDELQRNSSSRIDDLAREARTKRPKIAGKEEHLGDIPSWWLRLATEAGGPAAFLVGAHIWWLSTTRFNSSGTVGFSASEVEEKFGLNRFTAFRALSDLKKAGLVEVTKHKGRKSLVKILNPRKEK